MLISKKSALTGRFHEMDIPVTKEELTKWVKSGEVIQKAFPNLTPDQREFLLSGITPEEWQAMVKDVQ